MNRTQTTQLKLSENRERVRELLDLETRTDEQTTELDRLTREAQSLEVEYRAAVVAEPADPVPDGEPVAVDSEQVELRDLRKRCSLGRILLAGMEGRPLDGAEAEYRLAVGAAERSIPLDLFTDSSRGSDVEARADVVTPAQSPAGFRFSSIVPAVFSRSVAPRLGISMPRVSSGHFSVPSITTSLTAEVKAKGAAIESTAAAFSVATTSPHRVSARLSLTEEDVRSTGMPAFESSLRSNLRAVMGDLIDREVLRGAGTGASITGLMNRLTAAGAEANTVTHASFASKVAGMIDGKWAPTLGALRLLVNPAVYTKLASTFSSTDAMTALDWARSNSVGVTTSAQMPASVSNVGDGIAFRAGGGINPASAASMPAVMPVWGDLSIEDQYSDAARAIRHVTIHAFIGDVLVKQAGAYLAFKVKTA